MGEGRAASYDKFLGPDFAGFTVTAYEAGTAIKKDIYADPSKTTTAANPIAADLNGWIQFYADGEYRLDFHDCDGVHLRTLDPIRITQDVAAVWEGSNGETAPAANALNAWHLFVRTLSGAFTGLMVSDGSTYTDITSAVGAGWLSVKAFGAVGDGTTDDSAAIQATVDAAKDGDTVVFPGSANGYFHNGLSVQMPTDRSVTVWGGNARIVVGGANQVFTINNNSASPTAPRHTIKGLHFEADRTNVGGGRGITIQDSSAQTVEDCFFYQLEYGIRLQNANFWTEATRISNCLFWGNEFAIWISKQAATSKSFATTQFDHCAITTAGSIATTAYGIYIDALASIYRGHFGNCWIFPASNNGVAFWSNGSMRGAFGSLNLEGNNAAVTGNKGMWIGPKANLHFVDINMDIRGAIAEEFKFETADSDGDDSFDGFHTTSTTAGGPTVIRKAGFLSRLGGIVDSDLTTFHWQDRVTSSDRVQFAVNQDTLPEFVRADDVSALAGVRLLAVGSEGSGTFTDLDKTPTVKGITYMKASNTAATTITDFDDGIDGQRVIVLHTNSNTTIQNGASIITTTAANITGSVNLLQEFILGGTIWRQLY